MTLPRDPATSVNLAFDSAKAKVDTIQAQQAARFGAEEAPRASSRLLGPYALVEVELLHRLFEAADSFRKANEDTREVYRQRVVAIVDDTLRHLLPWHMRGLRSLSGSAQDSAIARMAVWNRPMVARSGKALGHDHRTWVAGFYNAGPTVILKRSLYRPAANAVRNAGDVAALVSPGVIWLPGRVAMGSVNLLFPGFGRVVSIPGVLEIELAAPFRAHSDRAGRNILVGALFERHYKSAISWFARLGYLEDRALIQKNPSARDVDFGGGISLMPLFPFVDNLQKFGLGGLAQKLRIRLGAQIDVRDWDPQATALQWQFVFYQR